MRKVQKTLLLPIDVADKLEEQDNQSVTTEQALRDYFGGDLDE